MAGVVQIDLSGRTALVTGTDPKSLIQRLIEPEEMASMVTCPASPLASATTGGGLRVDGGHVDGILP
ncbi:hypothetical protein GCM10009616_04530 [Microlunatus lacustris]